MIDVLWPSEDEFTKKPATAYVDVHSAMANSEKTLGFWTRDDIRPGNLLYASPPGLGKSTLTRALTQRLRDKTGKKVPMVTYTCSVDTREYHLVGTRIVIGDGSTPFIPGPIPISIEFANRTGLAVLCLEEMNALDPKSQTVLHDVTDKNPAVHVAQIQKTLALNEGCRLVVLATMNPGHFGGSNNLNPALRSRFSEVVIPWPDLAQEKKILKEVCGFASNDMITKAVTFAQETRTPTTEYNLGTRDLVTFLENVYKHEGDVTIPLTYLVNKFDSSERGTMADRADAIFMTKLKDIYQSVPF